jgi:branched-chain amino acid transport system substrate-binding protein
MFTPTRISAAVGAATAALALAACGASSKTSSNSTPATSSAAAASTTTASSTATTSAAKGTPFVLGAVCSCSGVQAAAFGGVAKVSSVWADSVNAAGGINGHPVKVIVMDDGGNPATALQNVKKLVQSDHIMALDDNSLADGAFASYIAGTGVPVVGGFAVSEPFLTNPDFFADGSNLPVETVGQALLAKAAGAKKFGVMYCSESPICAQVVPLAKTAATLAGLGFASQSLSSTAPSYTAPCLNFKSAGVDAMFVADNGAIVQRVQANCVQQSYKPMVSNSQSTALTPWLKDSNMQGALLGGTNATYTDPSVPGVKAFLDAVNKYAPGLTSSAQFNATAISPWIAGKLFEAAAKAGNLTPSSTSADIKRGLYALKNETLDGLAPPLNFVPGKPGFSPCYFGTTIKSGGFVALDNGKAACLTAAQTGVLTVALKKLVG